jgi:type VI secretion system protein ImpA
MDEENQDQALLLEKLLIPVSDAYPGGDDLQFLPVFGHIKEARRADNSALPQGEWLTSLKVAEWDKVVQLCEAALWSRSKDLQLAVWYVEALTHQSGYAGATFGFRLIAGLLDRFWESLDPRPDSSGDLEERVSKLEWLDIQLDRVLRELPLVSPQHGRYDWYQWQTSRETENLKRRDADAYEEALKAGALSGDTFDKAARSSGVIWFRELVANITATRAAFDELVEVSNRRFGISGAPSLAKMRGALDECGEVAQRFFVEYGGSEATTPTPSTHSRSEGTPSNIPTRPSSLPSQYSVDMAALGNRDKAIRQLREAAYWFRANEPHSPVALLVERAAHWAEMPFERWLSEVIKDKSTLEQLRELLNTEIDIPVEKEK